MKGMLAPLSPHEETALRKIAVGSDVLIPRMCVGCTSSGLSRTMAARGA